MQPVMQRAIVGERSGSREGRMGEEVGDKGKAALARTLYFMNYFQHQLFSPLDH